MIIFFVGKCFGMFKEFFGYFDGIKFGVWCLCFVIMYYIGGLLLVMWWIYVYGNCKVLIMDDCWMVNLVDYYGNELGWSVGLYFFFMLDYYCVLLLLDWCGVYVVLFNGLFWGVECVGDFDSEVFVLDLVI